MPFIKEGLEHGDYSHHLVDPARRGDHLRRLNEFGLDTAAAQRSGQLVIQDWPDFYLHDGRFSAEQTLRELSAVLAARKAKGFDAIRLIGDMGWTTQGWPGSDDFVEYESQANDIPLDEGDAVVCTYDLARFGGGTMMDALRIHPTVVVGAAIIENPLYMSPAEFLQDFRARTPAAVSER